MFYFENIFVKKILPVPCGLMGQACLKLPDTSDKLCWHYILSSNQNTSENVKSMGASVILFSSINFGIKSRFALLFDHWYLNQAIQKKSKKYSKTFPKYWKLFLICSYAEYLENYLIDVRIF